jgi:hypothetical protein
MFKVSFVKPQIGQQQDRQRQDRQRQERQPQEDQREAVNIRWHTINQSIRKLVRQKDSTTTSAEPPDKGGASAGNSINREKLIELPTDCPTELPEPLQHQKLSLRLARIQGLFVYARLISQSRGSILYRAWC